MDNQASKKLPLSDLFSERLSEAMERSGMKGKVIAELAGIDPGNLSRLKQGKRASPSLPVVRSLAYVLGVRTEWLASGEMPMTPEPEGAGRGSTRVAESSPGYRAGGLEIIHEMRTEVIRCIRSAQPPPARMLAMIGEIEAALVAAKGAPPSPREGRDD